MEETYANAKGGETYVLHTRETVVGLRSCGGVKKLSRRMMRFIYAWVETLAPPTGCVNHWGINTAGASWREPICERITFCEG